MSEISKILEKIAEQLQLQNRLKILELTKMVKNIHHDYKTDTLDPTIITELKSICLKYRMDFDTRQSER